MNIIFQRNLRYTIILTKSEELHPHQWPMLNDDKLSLKTIVSERKVPSVELPKRDCLQIKSCYDASSCFIDTEFDYE